MGTRGTYGFRKNGQDKLAYNHYDSYPQCLGANVIEFIKNFSDEQINKICDNITLVEEESKPSKELQEHYIEIGACDVTVSNRTPDDWYCLLRELQGDLNKIGELALQGELHMIDAHNFIADSLFCEYGYIINLDDKVVEFYRGFQEQRTVSRYCNIPPYECYSGTKYYACRHLLSFTFKDIRKRPTKQTVEFMDNVVDYYDNREY